MNNPYIGHTSQLYGVEEHRLVGGKGDGMRLLQVKNGKGLEFTVSADRCADISRLSLNGINFGYFSSAGYVAPAYYDDKGLGFLKSFTAGFLTTCGLTAVGSPCIDEGEDLPLHGTVGNCPAESIYHVTNEKEIQIHARINQAGIFSHKLILDRVIICSLERNDIEITDTVFNIGSNPSPLMILYHINIGYPLLSEQSELTIPSSTVIPRNEHANKDLSTWNKIIPPTPGFEEQCYYHNFEGESIAQIINQPLNCGLRISFDKESLDSFTQWKMMGCKDYVMGLEPGNCSPDGRKAMRESGQLKYIAPGDSKTFRINLTAFSIRK